MMSNELMANFDIKTADSYSSICHHLVTKIDYIDPRIYSLDYREKISKRQ